MRRREFIAGIGIAAAWRLAAHAQQPAPVIGFLSNASPDAYALRLDAFRRGLQETGFVEGQNVRIEYRWANGENARLGALAMELVNRGVAVIVAGGGTPAAMVAKAVVKTIPVVFAVAVDPVEVGLVPSLNHPGGNLTGITNLNVEMGPKKLEVVRELLPAATFGSRFCSIQAARLAYLFLPNCSRQRRPWDFSWMSCRQARTVIWSRPLQK